MHFGSIRFWVPALVAVGAAITPDFGSAGKAAAQAASQSSGALVRTGLPQAQGSSNATSANIGQQSMSSPVTGATPVFFSGRVISADGSALDDAAAVETVCNGVEHVEAYTDSKGNFSFQFGERNMGVFQDASIPERAPFGERSATPGRPVPTQWQLANCELQAKVPGYLSDSVTLSVDDPNVGSIIVHRLGKVEGKLVSVTSLGAPKGARKALEKGKSDLDDKKYDQALKNFEKAVTLYPDFATAWSELGKLQFAMGQKEEARRSFKAAIAADAKFLEPYLGLAALQMQDKDWKGVLETTGRTLELDPYDYPQAYYLNAVASFNSQDLQTAEKNAREAEKLDPHGRFPGARRLLSLILLKRHDYAQAADQMRGYLKLAPDAPAANEVRAQLAEIERAQAETPKAPGN